MPTSATPMSGRTIRKVAVLGAGTMGSRIAAHIANAGLPVVLLDIVPPALAPDASKLEKNKIVIGAIEALKKSKPAALYAVDSARLITPGNFEDDMALIADCDWILEAVAENLDIKHSLYAKVMQHRRADAILTSNTSGLPIATLAEAFPPQAKTLFFGTHFFNPPRYMRLLEIIPLPETSADAIATIEHFCDQRLGKAIVRSRDTPNFIANRIGTFSMGECHPPDAGTGAHDRRGRRADRIGFGMAEDGDLSSGRHGRCRCAGSCGAELRSKGCQHR